jgi:hypothetical protein
MSTDLFSGEAAVLRQLLRLTLAPPSPQLRNEVERGAINGLASAYFLLAMDRTGGVERFVTYHLGRIVQQLSRYTEQKEVAYSGQVRGRVLWSSTFKTRTTGDVNPYRFICREVERRYDTLENQLVKYVIEALAKTLHDIPEIVRRGACYFPAGGLVAPTLTATRLRRMETALNHLRYHVRLREIPLPTKISSEHLTAAANNRMEEYSELVHVYQQYHALCLQPQWDSFVQVGRASLPLPGTGDGEGEKWVQVAAAILHTPNLKIVYP